MTTPDNSFPGISLPEPDNEGLAPPPSHQNDQFLPPEDLTVEEESLFEDLITIGKIEKKIKFAGHHVYFSTLTVDRELQIGLLTKPYLNSDAYARAYKAAVVAGSVIELDGQPIYQPLSPHEDLETIMRKKFDIISAYYPVVVDLIYSKVMELEQELIPLVEKLGKTFG